MEHRGKSAISADCSRATRRCARRDGQPGPRRGGGLRQPGGEGAFFPSGARLHSNFLLLTFLSTIVAAIGLAEDNVAVVVGAMVIAPLLGPNITLAFTTSPGYRDVVWQALKTNFAGLTLAKSSNRPLSADDR